MKSRKVNITDIAGRTGLSITTVSRILNGKAAQYRISKVSCQKVIETAKELNYVPDLFASNLRTGKSKTIALIVPSLSNPFFADIAGTINSEVRKYGYVTLISDSDENPEIEEMELRQVVSRKVEGLIIVPCGNQQGQIRQVYQQGLPVICIDRYFENSDLPYVSTDNFEGAYKAAKHLIQNGHKRVACIQGVQQSTPNRLRVEGFRKAMEEHGLNSYTISGDDFSIRNGYHQTVLLLQQPERPTAIFTLSNTIAMGCIKALKEASVHIPDDISVITFDDQLYLDFLATPLSSIAQPVNDIGKMAVKFLFARINSQEMKVEHVLLKPEIIVRESVKRITN